MFDAGTWSHGCNLLRKGDVFTIAGVYRDNRPGVARQFTVAGVSDDGATVTLHERIVIEGAV